MLEIKTIIDTKIKKKKKKTCVCASPPVHLNIFNLEDSI